MKRKCFILVLILLGSLKGLFSQTPNTKINLELKNVTFQKAVNSFENKLGISINYATSIAPRKVSFRCYRTRGKKALILFLNEYGMTYKVVEGNTIVLKLLPKKRKQPNHKLSGKIYESASGEELIGCRIYNYANRKTSFTNEQGYFIMDLSTGNNILEYFYPGLEPVFDTLKGDRNYRINQALVLVEDSVKTVKTVQIRSNYRLSGNDLAGTVAGSHKLTSDKIKWTPQLLGETDVMRSLSSLPGVVAGSEGMLGIYVRGGNLDENLVLLDGVPIFNAYHLYGIFSSFNSDIVKNADLLKGYFPAKYGGRLSSIINIHSKDGNSYKLKGSASIGLLSSKVSLEGPLVKDKTTFYVSMRRSYLDFLTQQVANRVSVKDSLNNNLYYYFDANAKLTHRFSKRLKLGLSFYNSQDKGGYKQNTTTESIKGKIKESKEETSTWGNTLFSANLTYLHGNNTYIKLKAFQTKYNFRFDQKYAIEKDLIGTPSKIDDQVQYRLTNGVQDRELSLHLEKYLKWTTLNFGAGLINHKFTPGDRFLLSNINQSESKIEFNDNPSSTFEAYQYGEWTQNFSRRTILNIGIRNSIHFTTDKQLYAFPEPRIALKTKLGKNNWFNLSATQNYQFFHLLNNFTVGLPSDLWVPSTESIKPVKSSQLSFGFNKNLNMYSFSLEGFLKEYDNLLEYKETESYITNNTNWENIIASGKGNSHGLEFMAEKKKGRLRGWLSYTWLKSNRVFKDLNGGKAFPSRYDRRHNISITSTYAFNKKWRFSAAWAYASGFAFTLPIGKYVSPTPQDPYREIFIYEGRNNERARANHRLDISISHKRVLKRYSRTWVFGLFNAYNHHNPFFYQFLYNKDGQQELNSVSLLPIMPNLSYSIQF